MRATTIWNRQLVMGSLVVALLVPGSLVRGELVAGERIEEWGQITAQEPLGGERSAGGRSAVVYDSWSDPVGFLYAIPIDTGSGDGVSVFDSIGDDYITASGSWFMLDEYVFVGGVDNANEVMFFDFFDTCGNFINGFGVLFPEAGAFIWTITISTPFPLPGAGYINVTTDDGSVVVDSSGVIYTADQVILGTNDPDSMLVDFATGVDLLSPDPNIVAWGMSGTDTDPGILGEAFAQIDFFGNTAPVFADSPWGLYTVSVAPESDMRYINVTANDGLGGPDQWVVRNIPVVPNTVEPCLLTMTTTLDLTLLGVGAGDDLTSLDYYSELGDTPLIAMPTGSMTSIGCGSTCWDAEGRANLGDSDTDPGLPMSLDFLSFEGGRAKFHWNSNVPNIECGKMECGPAAAANSLEWLKNTYDVAGLTDTHAARLGTLKGEMNHTPAGGVGDADFIDGKLQYIGPPNNVPVITRFMDDGLGGANRTKNGRTALAHGLIPTWAFISQQINDGEDVEIGYTKLRPEPFEDDNHNGQHDEGEEFTDWNNNTVWDSEVPRGGHWVTAVGKISALGFKGIAFAHDRCQKPAPDRTGVDFSWIRTRDDGFLELTGLPRNKIDIVVSESPYPIGVCCIGPDCSVITDDECSADDGTYHGDDTVCVDDDGDGVATLCDNCPDDANPGQEDADGDGQGDACDVCPNDADDDIDGDGFCADEEECDSDPNKQEPGQCGCGNPDTDDDGDGVADCVECAPGVDDALYCPGCEYPDCGDAIPTVSAWGLVVLALLLLVVAKVYFGRRRSAALRA